MNDLSSPELTESLRDFNSRVRKNLNMNEHEVYNALVASGFFERLGYARYGIDIRSQVPIQRQKPDFYCLDALENVIFAMEVKKPAESTTAGFEQLWSKYVIPLKARHGVLTNGLSLTVYERIDSNHHRVLTIQDLGAVTENESNEIMSRLRKPDHQFQTLDELSRYLAGIEPASLKIEVVKLAFLSAFSLRKRSTFSVLLRDLMLLYEEQISKSRFLQNAWGYWFNTLAIKPEKFPKPWIEFLEGFERPMDEETQYKFMFCLETAHAIISRLILAKACQDIGFPDINVSDFLIRRIPHHRGRILEVGYPLVLIELSKHLRSVLVSSIFEDDIYGWWRDAYEKFRDEVSAHSKDFSIPTASFSMSLRDVLLILNKYNFSQIQGDLLGDLYQAYFDRETRRALGEFYTPEEVASLIVESVGYKETRNKRIIDPSCGSGTFIVQALKKYLPEAGSQRRHEWGSVLKRAFT